MIFLNLNVSTEITNNKLIISGSKKDLSIEKINFSYLITEEYKIGDEIKLTGKIINTDAEENSDEQTITIKVIEKKEENEKINEDVNNNSTQKDSQQTEKNEKQDNNKEQEQNTKNATQNKNQLQSESQENSKMQGNTSSNLNKTNTQNSESNNNIQINTKSSSSQNTKSQINTQNTASKVETNTYKDESNNYLSKLKISGYDISPKFDKTNNTYFITIEKDVEKLDITAKAEASSAIVTIYGNTNLKSGTNKILMLKLIGYMLQSKGAKVEKSNYFPTRFEPKERDDSKNERFYKIFYYISFNSSFSSYNLYNY